MHKIWQELTSRRWILYHDTYLHNIKPVFWNSLEWIFFHFYSVRILLGSSPCRIAFITVLWCAQLNKRTFTAWHNVMLQCHSNWVEPRTPEESLLSFRAKQTAISDFTTSIKRSLTEKCNKLPRMRKLLKVFLS